MDSSNVNLFYRKSLKNSKRLVIKIGTSSLTSHDGSLDQQKVLNFIKAVSKIKKEYRKDILVVTSGAIGAGLSTLNIKKRPKHLPYLQMAAAVGQSKLMGIYSDYFAKEGIVCAQVLLTNEDLKHRTRHVNTVNSFEALLKHNVIPVINENDVVAIDEIKLGDNDTLASMVAIMSKADLLILLTSVDGLRTSSKPGAERIPFILNVSNQTIALADGKTNQFSTGGMKTKLIACKKATSAGVSCLILDSQDSNSIEKALSGEDIGTFVAADAKKSNLLGKKRFTGFFQENKGVVILDAGASKMIRQGKASLLAVGILDVKGRFSAGSIVEIKSHDGKDIGRGVSNFTSKQISLYKGKRNTHIAKYSKELSKKPVVHKDSLVLL